MANDIINVNNNCNDSNNDNDNNVDDHDNDNNDKDNRGGQNTQMDFGPGQNNLMSVCADLRTQVSKLERTLEERELEISKLQANLSTEKSKYDSESRERAQIDATNGQLKRSIRELESQVLTLSVQKAELDVELTKLRIAQLQAQLDSAGPVTEAAATPPAAPLGRGILE